MYKKYTITYLIIANESAEVIFDEFIHWPCLMFIEFLHQDRYSSEYYVLGLCSYPKSSSYSGKIPGSISLETRKDLVIAFIFGEEGKDSLILL